MSLADALQKPLVPLLLEGLTWPPPGPMSPVLTQLLYVDCTGDNLEETWAGPKFDELLAVINQHLPRPQAQKGEEKSSLGSKPGGVRPPANSKEERKRVEAKSEQKATEAPHRIENSKRKEEPTVAKGTPRASVASPPKKEANGNNSSSQSAAQQQSAPVQDRSGNRQGRDSGNAGQGELNGAQSSCCVMQ